MKNVNFEMEIYVKERGGRAPRCMGSVPVAEMLASETRQPPHAEARQGAPGRVSSVAEDPSYCLFPGDQSGGHAGPGNSLNY